MIVSRKILILVVIILVLFGIILFYVLFPDFFQGDKTASKPTEEAISKEVPSNAQKEPRTVTFQPIDTTEQIKAEVKKAKEFSKDDLLRLASSFAERYGSYSNQSNFANISDLKLFMTKRMQVWANDYVAGQQALDSDTSIYYGITTKSVAEEIRDYDDDEGAASILVKTRRREASGTTSNTSQVFDQNILINFVKEQGSWKVDSANWLNK